MPEFCQQCNGDFPTLRFQVSFMALSLVYLSLQISCDDLFGPHSAHSRQPPYPNDSCRGPREAYWVLGNLRQPRVSSYGDIRGLIKGIL